MGRHDWRRPIGQWPTLDFRIASGARAGEGMALAAPPPRPGLAQLSGTMAPAGTKIMSREFLLSRVRSALGRKPGQAVPPPPPVWLLKTEWTLEEKLASFEEKLEKLAGVVHMAQTPDDALEIVSKLIAGKTAVASNAALLAELKITNLPGVSVAGHDTGHRG